MLVTLSGIVIEESPLHSLEYINTYNGEEYLSQTLLWCPFRRNEDDYVIISVHNGCHVRSGYTSPQLFKTKDLEYFIFGQYDRVCECECGYNNLSFYSSDNPIDDGGNYVSKEDIYSQTYVDDEGDLRCKECNSIIKGGFKEW